MDSSQVLEKLNSYLPDIIKKNYKYIFASFLFILTSNYLASRYTRTVNTTRNRHYTKPMEHNNQSPIKHLNSQKTYLFWNGNLQSTYNLITKLKQGLIIQPLYIEEYTILKGIDDEKIGNVLETVKKSVKGSGKLKITDVLKMDSTMDEYVTYLKKIREKQQLELKRMEIVRLKILEQFPELVVNLLPTMYITGIDKDMAFTGKFAQLVAQNPPIHYDHIEICEQMLRFAKVFSPIENTSAIIEIPLTTDSKTYTTIQKLIALEPTLFISSKVNFPSIQLNKDKIKMLAMYQRFYNILQECK